MVPMENILVLTPMPPEKQDALRHVFRPHQVRFCEESMLSTEDWSKATVIVGNPEPKNLHQATALRWLQLHSAGVDRYSQAQVFTDKFVVSNAVGAYGHAVAEHMLTMLLMLLKKMPAYHCQQIKGIWQPQGTVQSVSGLRILVVGFGDLGCAFAKRAYALGARVTGVRRSVTDKPQWVEAMIPLTDVHNALPEADVVALFLPSTPATRALVDEAWFHHMKPSAWLLNAGRGDAVQTEALVNALTDGHIAGAALDVLPHEPLPQNHPLWRMPNVLITPHVAGGFNMMETTDRVYDLILENSARYVKGLPVDNQYDGEKEKTLFIENKAEVKNE